MSDSRISSIIKNLSTDEEAHSKRFDVFEQLNKAMQLIHPDKTIEMTEDQRVAYQLVTDAIYTAHLFSLRYYQVNDALAAISRIQRATGNMTAQMSQRRPRIPLVGIAAGERLMPVSFQSEAEANSYKDAIQVALGNGQQLLHLTTVELSTTVVDNVPVVPPVIDAPTVVKHLDEDLKTITKELQSKLPNPPLKVGKVVDTGK